MSDIQSVKRAFDILKAMSSSENAVSLSEIATRVALPKSTVSRMLTTLQGIGAVERAELREGFRLGDELIALTAHMPYPRSLSAVARPFLQDMVSQTGETATLCVPDGDSAHYIDQINSARALQVHDWTNHRLPLHASSDGKLYLAYRSAAQTERYARQVLRRFSRTTLVNTAALTRELKTIRKQGYAWTNGEYDADIVGVAAPIRDVEGAVVASICLFGPAFRWPKERDAGKLIQLTKDTATKISVKLGTLSKKYTK
jgi:DNA-binding IclR family transcriptional regulator